MDYYKITKIPKNKYIISYEVKKDIIVMKLANNEKYVVKNTIDNENKILERMNKQASLVVNNKKSKRVIEYILIYGLGITGICIFGYQAFFNINSLINGLISLRNIAFTIFSIISMIYITVVLNCINKEDRDLKKIKLYCEAKELLNNNLKKSSINVFNKLSFRAVKQISDRHMDEEPFTINSINKMSLKDLQLFKDNIGREKEFDLEKEPLAYKTRVKRKN